jgi:hypothetical protein
MNPVFHFIEQRTPEWDALRRGKFTASMASKLVTPTGKPSLQYRGEIARIIAEARGLQEPEFIRPTYWMERGINLEAEARAWFEVETDLKIEDVGFVSDEGGVVGASPDGLIKLYDGDTFGFIPLELKCPKPSTHVGYLLDGGIPTEHIAQVHFQIALCEAPYGYFCSYNPNIAPLILRVDRNEYTKTMEDGIVKYAEEFKSAVAKIGEL